MFTRCAWRCRFPVSIRAHRPGDVDVQEVSKEEDWIRLILVTALLKAGSFTRC